MRKHWLLQAEFQNGTVLLIPYRFKESAFRRTRSWGWSGHLPTKITVYKDTHPISSKKTYLIDENGNYKLQLSD